MTAPRWALGPGSVYAGRDIRGPVTITVVNGAFDRLRDAIFDPAPLAEALDLEHFTGRAWLIDGIDDYIATHRKGYVVVQSEAGVGKSTLAAHLVWTRPWAHHFTRLEGARSPEQARRSLAAQLIGMWGLAHDFAPGDAFPAGADRPDWLLKVMRAAADRRDLLEPGRPVVLVVDGLDEADQPAPGQDTGIPLGLPRPEHLPDGVFIVATSRFGPPLAALHDRVSWHTIRVDGPGNLDDMRRYIEGTVHGPGARPQLVGLLQRQGVAPTWFVDTLVRQCAGVWIYLQYVLDAILDGQRSAANLDTLPGGLAAYYAEQIQRWRTSSTWATVGVPALATLVALRRPATIADLGQLVASPVEPMREWLDERLRPFLDVSRDQRRRRFYAIRHQSLRDLFHPDGLLDAQHDTGMRDELNDALVDAHRRITTALTPTASTGRRDWTGVDDYTRTTLAEHAAACGLLDQLMVDAGFLLAIEPSALLRSGAAVTSPDGRAALSAYKLALGQWRDQSRTARAWSLHVWARKTNAHRLAVSATQLSGSEWTVERAWWTGHVHQVLCRHEKESVRSVAVGRLDARDVIVIGIDDGTVQVWDSSGQEQPILLPGRRGHAYSVAIGRLAGRDVVVLGDRDGTVRIWDPTAELEPIVVLQHGSAVASVATGRLSGRDVVLSGGEATVRVWDAAGQTEPLVLSIGYEERKRMSQAGERIGPADMVAVVRIGARELVIARFGDWTMRAWDPTGHPVSLLSSSGVDVARLVAVGRIGDRDVIVRGSEALYLSDEVERKEFPGRLGRWDAVAVGRVGDQEVVVAGDHDGTLRVWDLGRDAEPMVLSGHRGGVTSVAIGRVEGRDVIVSGSSDKTVRIWELGWQTEREEVVGMLRPLESLAVGRSEAGDVVVAGSTDGSLRLWAPDGQAEPAVLSGHDGGVQSVAIGRIHARSVIVSGGRDGTVRTWDLGSHLQRAVHRGHGRRVECVALGRMAGRDVVVYSAGAAGTVWILDLDGERETSLSSGHRGHVYAVAFGRVTGRDVIVTGGADRTVRILDPDRRAGPAVLTGHRGYVLSVAVGRFAGRDVIASGGADRTVRIWDVDGDGRQMTLFRHQGWVRTVATGAVHGRDVIVSGDEDGSVWIWDGDGRSEPRVLPGHQSWVRSVAVGQVTGRGVIVSGDEDGTMLLWSPSV